MTDIEWTTERVNALRAMAAHGMTAKEIGAALGATRNAVLGKCHRIGISLAMNDDKQARASQRLSAWHKKHPRLNVRTNVRLSLRERLAKENVGQIIQHMRDSGKTWAEIAARFGMSTPNIRVWAELTGYKFKKNNQKISEEEIAYIIKSYNSYVPVEEIADTLGRSYGVTRQIILRLQKRSQLGNRDGYRFKAIHHYGCNPDDPRDGRVMLAEAVEAKRARELNDAEVLRRSHEDAVFEALEAMANNIENGMSREEAMLKAREVCTLEEIAACFGITRERVRQICAKLEKRRENGEGCSGDDGRGSAN